MEIAISGGTGFIGKALTLYLASNGHTVYILTRHLRENHSPANIRYINWDADASEFPLSSVDIVINLAGESINNGRWTKKQKEKIINSRINTTKGLIEQLQTLNHYPNTFINASAIGYYGTSETDLFTEEHPKQGNDFLATTVQLWEEEASKATDLGIRTIYTRFGIVLGKDGGALPKMLLPYQFFIGGTIGSGNQLLSWVHLEDVVQMIDFAIHTKEISGAFNITAPHPVTMKEFGRTIAKVLYRPHWLPVPAFALKTLLGEMSSLILQGQRVLPQKAIQHGYTHSYATLEHALQNIASHS
ncbi:TIGR01777 family oxidoreductase [Bacillus cereus group sp. BfR-BA-01380]|uniref:TIGR01777 family oxidoreductase n=1 Tax=Bacillus cereus group sp. BfR-BA-01380 TaxID=2920324 RepID=UPI001F58A61C|nr:TIGR01777 family oxidoreductase [Bacillus cereus group sp. BfR-BA-01380]